MSEFFLELFSEEIPANLQVNARKALNEIFVKFLKQIKLKFKEKLKLILLQID